MADDAEVWPFEVCDAIESSSPYTRPVMGCIKATAVVVEVQ